MEALSNLGHYGQMLLDLLQAHNKPLYKQLLKEGTLMDQLEKAEQDYLEDLSNLARMGLNQSEAREAAWPDITQRFGIK